MTQIPNQPQQPASTPQPAATVAPQQPSPEIPEATGPITMPPDAVVEQQSTSLAPESVQSVVAPTAEPVLPPEGTLRAAFQSKGFDVNAFADDDQLINAMNAPHQRLQELETQVGQLGPIAAQYVKEQSDIQRELDAERVTESQQPQEDPNWNPPSFDKQWLPMLQLNEQGDYESTSAQVPFQVVQQANALREYRRKFGEEFAEHPYDTTWKGIEPRTRDLVNQIVEERLQHREQSSKISDFVQRNESYLYQHDQQGNRVVDPATQQHALTPAGAVLQEQFVKASQSFGLGEAQAWDYASNVLQERLMAQQHAQQAYQQAMQQSQQAAAPDGSGQPVEQQPVPVQQPVQVAAQVPWQYPQQQQYAQQMPVQQPVTESLVPVTMPPDPILSEDDRLKQQFINRNNGQFAYAPNRDGSVVAPGRPGGPLQNESFGDDFLAIARQEMLANGIPTGDL